MSKMTISKLKNLAFLASVVCLTGLTSGHSFAAQACVTGDVGVGGGLGAVAVALVDCLNGVDISGGNLSANNSISAGGNLSANNNVSAGGNLGVSGQSNLSGPTTISSSLNVANANGANLNVNTTANVAVLGTSTSTPTVKGATLTLTGGAAPSAVLSSFGGTAGGSSVAGPALSLDGTANSATLITATGQGLSVAGERQALRHGFGPDPRVKFP